jgi:hypothetical protein
MSSPDQDGLQDRYGKRHENDPQEYVHPGKPCFYAGKAQVHAGFEFYRAQIHPGFKLGKARIEIIFCNQGIEVVDEHGGQTLRDTTACARGMPAASSCCAYSNGSNATAAMLCLPILQGQLSETVLRVEHQKCSI